MTYHAPRRLPRTLVLALSLPLAAWAQTSPPDAGSLLREAPKTKEPLPARPATSSPEAPAASKTPSGPRIRVKGFRLQGHTQFSDAELQQLIAAYIGRELSFAEIQQAAVEIAEHYRRHGWLARAFLPAQDIVDGIVTLVVVEGRLGKVRVDPASPSRLDAEIGSDFILSRQLPGQPVRIENLQHSLSLLNALPGVAAAAVLEPGRQIGESDIALKLSDKPIFAGQASLDNQGSRSTGRERLIGQFNFDNPLGRGEQFQANAMVSSHTDFIRVAYNRPLGGSGLRGGANLSGLRYSLGREFVINNAYGNAETLGLNLAYPLVLTPERSVQFTANWDNKRLVNYSNGLQSSDKRVELGSVGLSGDMSDQWAGGGVTQYGVQYTRGRIDLSANPTNLQLDVAQTNGGFDRMNYNLSRLQRLGGDTSLIAALSGQWAGKNLDSGDKFSLGGANGVRAYPSLEGSGDEGWLINLELRHNYNAQFQVGVFYDIGGATLNKSPWTGWNAGNPDLPSRYTLQGMGIGASWVERGDYSVRAQLATKLGKNPGRNAQGKDSDGSDDKSRLWLTAVKLF